MRFTISKSQYGDKIYYIARDSSGEVRMRADTAKQIEKEIEEFNKRKETPIGPASTDLPTKKADIEEPKEEKTSSKEKVARKEPAPQKKFYGYRRGK